MSFLEEKHGIQSLDMYKKITLGDRSMLHEQEEYQVPSTVHEMSTK